LTEKVQRLKVHLESLNRAVDDCLVVASARGYAVEKPTPSARMGQRAHLAIDRAVIHSSSHVQLLLHAMEDLRQRSSPDRLPQVVAGIGDACMQLDAVLSSPEFRACVGDRFPHLPRLSDVALGGSQNQIEADMPSQPQILDLEELEGDSVCDLRTAENLECNSGTDTSNSLRTAGSLQRDDLMFEILQPHTLSQGAATPTLLPSFGRARITPAFEEVRNGASGRQCPDTNQYSSKKVSTPSKFDTPEPATVFRLVPSMCGRGLVRHDERRLILGGGLLDVCEKHSKVKVKTSLDVVRDIEDCTLLPGRKRLSLTIRAEAAGAGIDSGVCNMKGYFFEFGTPEQAIEWHGEITRLRKTCM